ncbi:MAG: RidA family protein [Gammaproteobacteria bacterium]
MARLDQVINIRPALEKHFGFSQIVDSGSYVFFSGSAAMDENGALKGGASMAEQVRTVYTELCELLARVGAAPEHVVKETVYTVDMDALVAAADVRAAFFSQCAPPASSWIEVRRLYRPEFLIEVELIVEKPAASCAGSPR